MTLYMAVTADKYELPLIVGSAEDIARFAGIKRLAVYNYIARKMSGKRNGYKLVSVEVED